MLQPDQWLLDHRNQQNKQLNLRDKLYGELGLEKRGQPLPRLRRLVQMLLMLLGIDFGFELLLALPCISPATLSTSVGYTSITDTGSPKTLASSGSYAGGSKGSMGSSS